MNKLPECIIYYILNNFLNIKERLKLKICSKSFYNIFYIWNNTNKFYYYLYNEIYPINYSFDINSFKELLNRKNLVCYDPQDYNYIYKKNKKIYYQKLNHDNLIN